MAKAKKKSTSRANAVERLAAASQLRDIRLVETHCRQAIKEGPFPDQTETSAQIESKLNTSTAIFLIITTFRLNVRYADGTPEPGISIAATFQMTFKTPVAVPLLRPNTFQEDASQPAPKRKRKKPQRR